MYCQVCSNSAYSQRSGERHRTNGPLVCKYSLNVCVPYSLGARRHRKLANPSKPYQFLVCAIAELHLR